MQTLAQILAGIPADPYEQNQGIAPLLQQRMQAAQQNQPGMQQMPPPGMMGQDQLNMLQGGPMGGANEPLPPELFQQLLLRHQQQQQQQQPQPGLGSMGNPMGGGY